jgi:RNA polymerase sigma factor (TIGR02999 family)
MSMAEDRGEVTRLLDAMSAGDSAAVNDLLPRVYDELRILARARLAGERRSSAPQATSLVHEAYLRLVGSDEPHWQNRAHFFGAAGEAMRRILVDQARERGALKRGGDRRQVTLDERVACDSAPPAEDVLAVDQALSRLERRDPGMAAVVKLRYFAGLTVDEVAAALGSSSRTVHRQWTGARAWLQKEMRSG